MSGNSDFQNSGYPSYPGYMPYPVQPYPNPQNDTLLVDIDEACKMLAIDKSTMMHWITNKRMPSGFPRLYEITRNCRRFRRKDLLEFVDKLPDFLTKLNERKKKKAEEE